MPAPKTKEGRSAEYRSLYEAAREFNERNDCAVKAVALACGVDYGTAHRALTSVGRKIGKGTAPAQTKAAMALLGKDVERVMPFSFIQRYPGSHATALKSVTTHHPERFRSVWQDGKTYLLHSSEHIACVVNGVLHDWSVGRAKRVLWIEEVVDIEKGEQA